MSNTSGPFFGSKMDMSTDLLSSEVIKEEEKQEIEGIQENDNEDEEDELNQIQNHEEIGDNQTSIIDVNP